MNDIKFVCPSCGQKIKVDATASGRQLACPGCKSELVIPAAPKVPGEVPPAVEVGAKKPAPTVKPPAAATDAAKLEISKPLKVEPAAVKPALIKSAGAVEVHPAVEVGAKKPAPTVKPPAAATDAGKLKISKPLKVEPAAVKPAGSADVDVPAKPLPEEPAKAKAEQPTISIPAEAKAAGATPGETSTARGKRTQVARLTPTLKRDIIRSVRRRIAEEAHWMPRITAKGEYAYAAKDVDGQPVSVEATSPEATRFSLLGAALLELHLRKVTRTAAGRPEFLDDELLDGIRQVAGDAASAQEAGSGELMSKGKAVPPISHAQSLEALAVLEERYAKEIEAATDAQGTTAELHLVDLTRRIERKVPVTIEELCAALDNELKEINERLTALENPSV